MGWDQTNPDFQKYTQSDPGAHGVEYESAGKKLIQEKSSSGMTRPLRYQYDKDHNIHLYVYDPQTGKSFPPQESTLKDLVPRYLEDRQALCVGEKEKQNKALCDFYNGAIAQMRKEYPALFPTEDTEVAANPAPGKNSHGGAPAQPISRPQTGGTKTKYQVREDEWKKGREPSNDELAHLLATMTAMPDPKAANWQMGTADVKCVESKKAKRGDPIENNPEFSSHAYFGRDPKKEPVFCLEKRVMTADKVFVGGHALKMLQPTDTSGVGSGLFSERVPAYDWPEPLFGMKVVDSKDAEGFDNSQFYFQYSGPSAQSICWLANPPPIPHPPSGPRLGEDGSMATQPDGGPVLDPGLKPQPYKDQEN